MPRVKLNRTESKMNDFNKWLKKKMIDYDMNQSDVARLINVQQSALSKKCKNNSFTLEEFIILSNYFIDSKTNKKSDDEVSHLIIYQKGDDDMGECKCMVGLNLEEITLEDMEYLFYEYNVTCLIEHGCVKKLLDNQYQ